jgi:hypothetical protein
MVAASVPKFPVAGATAIFPLSDLKAGMAGQAFFEPSHFAFQPQTGAGDRPGPEEE